MSMRSITGVVVDQIEVRSGFERVKVAHDFSRGGRTRQEFVGECDINNILAKYQSTALMPQHQREAIYGDFASMPDYQSALNLVISAQESFAQLPSSLRARFDNDPANFLAFVQDPANADELVELGLREAPKPPAEPIKVEVTNPVPAPSS